MLQFYGQCNGPLLLLHGGAGSQDPRGKELQTAVAELRRIAKRGIERLGVGVNGLDVVAFCLQEMEASEVFNAGRGAALQADGQARLTAALMDGTRQTLSGVIGATAIIHPSNLARKLQTSDARVISSPGVELLARKLGIPVENALTQERVDRWYEQFKTSKDKAYDTVGCVVRAVNGSLFSGTSTGGRGFEFPGRVSDAATVAGTYASKFAAMSATGTGEEIVDDALCARVETRCRDGLSLEASTRKTFEEAERLSRSYGLIAADAAGNYAVCHTTPSMSYVAFGPKGELLAPNV